MSREHRGLPLLGWLVLPLAALVLLCLTPGPAWAHAVSIGQSKIRQEGEVVHYDLAVDYAELAKRLELRDPPAAGPGESTDAQREAALRSARRDLQTYLAQHLRVSLDGVGCEARLETIDVERFQGQLYALLASSYRCPAASGYFAVQYDLFFDSVSDADRHSHANVADYDVGGEKGRFVFERDEQRLAAGGGGVLGTAGRFIALGLEHILTGLDHVLFVLALLLGARSVRTIVKVATTFTAAHSVTLALAAMNWVSLPPAIVEPAIALSIGFVALQSIVQKEPSHRLPVVFAFGLMHGLGFAGNLSFGDDVSWGLVSSLLAFNVGIEVGQASVILLVAPLLLFLRRRRWSTPAHWAASGVIALCGLVWFVGRLAAS